MFGLKLDFEDMAFEFESSGNLLSILIKEEKTFDHPVVEIPMYLNEDEMLAIEDKVKPHKDHLLFYKGLSDWPEEWSGNNV